jgi:hypothetical protein
VGGYALDDLLGVLPRARALRIGQLTVLFGEQRHVNRLAPHVRAVENVEGALTRFAPSAH